MTILINADDFGYSEAINRAIVESVSRGYCSSTTLMANMPDFEPACEAAHERRFADRVGLHMVLTEGTPLTDRLRACPRFCDEHGQFRLTRRTRVLRLATSEKRALADEMRAQIRRCRRHHLPLTHADSHNHVHEEWAIAAVLIAVSREEGIPAIRPARNCGPPTARAKRMYRNILNRRIRRAGLARTEYFGSYSDALHLMAHSKGLLPGSAEIMIHPGYDEHGCLIDRIDGEPFSHRSRLLPHTACGSSPVPDSLTGAASGETARSPRLTVPQKPRASRTR